MHRAILTQSALCKPCLTGNKIFYNFCIPQRSKIFEMNSDFAYVLPKERKSKFLHFPGAGRYNKRHSNVYGFWLFTWSWGESCCWVYGSSWENCCCGTSSSPWSKPSSNTKPFQHNAKQQYMKANKEMKTSSRQIVKTNMLQFSKKKFIELF